VCLCVCWRYGGSDIATHTAADGSHDAMTQQQQQQLQHGAELNGIDLPLWSLEEFFQLEHINEGYYGNVYKCVHRDSKEVFVLKELKEEEDESRDLFLGEIQMLSKLQHPNVIKCKGVVFTRGGHIAYLSEYIEGGTLQELLIRQQTLQLPWDTYLKITLDVARGMAYIHCKGIIHRDLNSKNVLVREVHANRYKAFIIPYILHQNVLCLMFNV